MTMSSGSISSGGVESIRMTAMEPRQMTTPMTRANRTSTQKLPVRAGLLSAQFAVSFGNRPQAVGPQAYSLSMIVPLAIPPPSHMVCRP